MTITKGDPANRTDTLVTYLYKLAFYNGKQGSAAAVSVIGFLILLLCASLYMVSVLKKETNNMANTACFTKKSTKTLFCGYFFMWSSLQSV